MRPDRDAWLPLRKAPAAPRKERGQEQGELSYRAKNEKSKHALFIRIPTCSLSTTFFSFPIDSSLSLPSSPPPPPSPSLFLSPSPSLSLPLSSSLGPLAALAATVHAELIAGM